MGPAVHQDAGKPHELRSRGRKGWPPCRRSARVCGSTPMREAAAFYTSIFSNSRIVEVARYGEAGPGPEGSVMTVSFELDGQEFLGLNGGPQFTFNEAISLQVHCE